LFTELLETSLRKTVREFASLTRVNIRQLGNAIVGAAEPPTELAGRHIATFNAIAISSPWNKSPSSFSRKRKHGRHAG
jgi:hypothetical protein